jgi:hypothetical protein
MTDVPPPKGSEPDDAELPESDEEVEASISGGAQVAGLEVSRLQAHIRGLTPAMSIRQLRPDVFVTVPSVQKAAASLLANQMKFLDGLTPPVLLMPELDATIKAANLLGANSALSAWREALKTQHHWIDRDFLRSVSIQPHIAQQISSLSLTTVKLTEIAALTIKPAEFMSAGSVRALSVYSRSLSAEVTRQQLDVLHFGTSGVNASVGADLASSEAEPDESGSGLSEIDTLVIEPWRRERSRAFDALRDTLGGIDPSVPEMIAGVWDDIERQGPAAASKIANCLVEAIDRTLRGLAPADSVAVWVQESGRGELLADGKPTRAARVCFILRADPSAAAIADEMDKTIAKLAKRLNDRLQKGKHTTGSAVQEVTCFAFTVEGLLALLTGLPAVGDYDGDTDG